MITSFYKKPSKKKGGIAETEPAREKGITSPVSSKDDDSNSESEASSKSNDDYIGE